MLLHDLCKLRRLTTFRELVDLLDWLENHGASPEQLREVANQGLMVLVPTMGATKMPPSEPARACPWYRIH
jgi:hypothetical protein